MGAPKLQANEIPFLTEKTGRVIKEQLQLGDREFPVTCVNVGNPHCVIFEADFLKTSLFNSFNDIEGNISKTNFFPTELVSIAEALEVDSRFPEHTNIEFVNVVDRKHIQVFVWERGSKATLACGSGAVATAVASILEGRTDKKVSVTLPGGTLFIDWSDDKILKMTGGADLSFYGQINVPVEIFTSGPQSKSHTKVKVS
jgi:diaminopimelate epimerase